MLLLYFVQGPANLSDLGTRIRKYSIELIDSVSLWQNGYAWMTCRSKRDVYHPFYVNELKSDKGLLSGNQGQERTHTLSRVANLCVFRFHPLNTCVNFTIDGGEFGQIHHNPIHVRVRLNIDLIKSDSPVGLVSSTVLQATSCQNSLGRERVKPRVLL